MLEPWEHRVPCQNMLCCVWLQLTQHMVQTEPGSPALLNVWLQVVMRSGGDAKDGRWFGLSTAVHIPCEAALSWVLYPSVGNEHAQDAAATFTWTVYICRWVVNTDKSLFKSEINK